MSISSQRRAVGTFRLHQSPLELAEDLADELARRWAHGERPKTEEYLLRYPQLVAQPEAALELVCEEIYQEQLAGEERDASAWLQRFPQWRPQIEMLLACQALLEQGAPEPRFPEPQEMFGEFQLLEQLGRGAHGRVYLALQSSLGDRPVVLKLTSLAGQEHISLARLQHTYIMPLYWAQDFPDARLRALCMPFFGGATLAELLDRLQAIPPAKRTGRDLFAAHEQAGKDQGLALPIEGPACQLWQQASYVEAICWIGACLAEALDYAHQRRVVHYDLKPSNVLIAADGQPLLLDFHLAQSPLEAGVSAGSWLGGTPHYMSPEQAAGLAATQCDLPITQQVDGRADLYSLALVLAEALAGEPLPQGKPSVRWLRRKNNQVSAGLADILAKCLSNEPWRRYPDAAALAADLRRHLANRPLEHVANRNIAERWRKWRRRRPYALAAFFFGAAVSIWGAMEVSRDRQNGRAAEQALAEAKAEVDARRFELANLAIERAAQIAAGIPWRGAIRRQVEMARQELQSAVVAQELHQLVGAMRSLDGADGLPLQDARRLEDQARRLWDQRDSIATRLARPSGSSAAGAEHDLVELALLWSDLHLRTASGASRRQAAREALEVLLEAERLAGEQCVLCRAQRQFALDAGQPELASQASDKAARLLPVSAWEHYALGRLAQSAGNADEADAEFQAALQLDPQGLWPNFYRARAAYEHGRYDEAATAFTVCLALAPKAAWCYYNRALAYLGRGSLELARQDFDRSLELEPDLTLAALNRGMLSYQQERYDEALKDFQLAAANGADPASVHYAMALTRAAQGNEAAAGAELDQLFRHDPNHQDGRKLAKSLKATAR